MRRGSFRKAGKSKPVIYAVAILSILTAGLLVAGFCHPAAARVLRMNPHMRDMIRDLSSPSRGATIR